ncbi:hypothetical protein D6774_00035 [Candidatus Woesearchaeota archaeon]|nr:MAG: hypothetical protein D6774_00035 [Candidatus Woesearchaeota archaeon]
MIFNKNVNKNAKRKGSKKKPVKQKPSYTDKPSVSAEHYNDMITFYTRALEEKNAIIEKLRRDNSILMKSLVRKSEKLVELESEKIKRPAKK